MDVLSLNIKALQFFFLWPQENRSPLVNFTCKFIYVTVVSATAFAVIAAVIYQCLKKIEDVQIMIEAIIGMADYFMFCYMYGCFAYKQDSIQEIINGITVFLHFCNEEIIMEAEEQVRSYTKWAFVYFSTGLFVNALLPLFDIKGCTERRLSDFYREHDPCGMPTRNIYPFDASGPITFPFVFVMEIQCEVSIALGVLAVTMCLIGLLIHIVAQLQNLRHLLLTAFSDNDANLEDKVTFCIKYHTTIIDYAVRVNKAFHIMMISYITITSLVISLLGYEIILSTNSNDKIRYIMHLGGWVGLLFMTCYYGQKLINESAAVADAGYNSKWYSGPIGLQRNVQLIVMRAQKPLTLTAASFGVMSFDTFVKVMKSAYSYFALLVTISQDE